MGMRSRVGVARCWAGGKDELLFNKSNKCEFGVWIFFNLITDAGHSYKQHKDIHNALELCAQNGEVVFVYIYYNRKEI